jgi:hypothetical protein
MVHYITQALAVLLLEVSCHGADFPRDQQNVIPSLEKLLRWLRAMRVNNTMAVRAYDISFRLLKKLATHIDVVSCFDSSLSKTAFMLNIITV